MDTNYPIIISMTEAPFEKMSWILDKGDILLCWNKINPLELTIVPFKYPSQNFVFETKYKKVPTKDTYPRGQKKYKLIKT